MKCQKEKLSYFDIFPNAALDVEVIESKKPAKVDNPKIIQNIIKGIFNLELPPKWIKIEHPPLCQHIAVAIFEGLDEKRYQEHQNQFPSFASLHKNGFPIVVEAKEKDGFVISGIHTALGYQKSQRVLKKFKNYEEMVILPEDLLDNGYPIHTKNMKIPSKPKCAYYNLPILTEEQLKQYKELPEETNENTRDIIAIDCEMIYTKSGPQVARLSVLDKSGNMILDQLFKPTEEVVDYKTKFSGLTEEILSEVTATPDQAVEYLSKVASKNTIIIGHSLENDFRSLKLIHLRCIDTAVLFPNEQNKNKKPSLSFIYKKYINKPFRAAQDEGHDSTEDAGAALELVKLAMKESISSVEEKPKMPEFLDEMCRIHGQVCLIERKSRVNFESMYDTFDLKTTENDSETLNIFVEKMKENDLVFAHFEVLNGVAIKDESVSCDRYNSYMKTIIESLPQNSILIVYAANGNFTRISAQNDSKLPPGIDIARRDEFNAIRQGLLWIHCSETK